MTNAQISLFQSLNIYKNVATGNCTNPKCGQLQLEKTRLWFNSVWSYPYFSPINWTYDTTCLADYSFAHVASASSTSQKDILAIPVSMAAAVQEYEESLGMDDDSDMLID